MREKPRDKGRLQHIIQAIDNVMEFKESHTELPWDDIAGMRHVLVHDYYQITPARVWDTVTTDLVVMRSTVVTYLASMPDDM